MKKHIVSILFIILLAAATYIFVAAAAGGSDDPVVSLSYLTGIFKTQLKSELSSDIKSQVEAAKPEIISQVSAAVGTGGTSPSYIPVMLKQGQTVMGNEGGIEVLLRRGSFKCIDPAGDKITNVTKGGEAGNGDELTLQNLYLIPRNDGRGITATTESWIMVRGSYSIK